MCRGWCSLVHVGGRCCTCALYGPCFVMVLSGRSRHSPWPILHTVSIGSPRHLHRRLRGACLAGALVSNHGLWSSGCDGTACPRATADPRAVPVRARSGRGLIMGSQQSTAPVLSRQQMDALIDGHFRAAVSHCPQAGRWQSLVLIGLRTTMLRESRPALAFRLREGVTK